MFRTLEMRRRLMLLSGFAVAALALPASSAAAQQPTLTGEFLQGVGDATACGQPGYTWTFDVSGGADGPYPGTFTETGSFTTEATPEGPDPVTGGAAQFTITSGSTVITGTTSPAEGLESQCFGSLAAALGGGLSDEGDLEFGPTTYEATITTETGCFTDRGTSELRIAATLGPGPNFLLAILEERFTSDQTEAIPCEPEPANDPPDCSNVSASPSSILPATRDQMKTVSLAGATDPDGDPLAFHIDGVTQDEPVIGEGIGDDTSPDAEFTPAGADSNQVQVRAERNPRGDGRVYRIAYTVSDDQGGSCSGTANVSVPRKKGEIAVDSAPPSYDSFTGAQT